MLAGQVMDPIIHYTSVSHADSVMASINQMRLDADLCDIVVVVGNIRIQAHGIILAAAAPSFYQMSKMYKSHLAMPEYKLDGLDESAALKVLEFCYTSAISVDENNVWSILVAATKLGCQEIIDLCCDLLSASLDLASCVPTHLMAAGLNCGDLMIAAGKFIAENINMVCVSDKFLCLSSQEFLELVSSLSSVQENQLLELTKAWLDHDVIGRKTTVLPLIEEFPSWSVSLHKYIEANVPPDQPLSGALITCGDQATEEEFISGWHSSTGSEKSLVKEAPLHICFSCGEVFDDHLQLCQHVLECSESAHAKPRVLDNPGMLSIEESVDTCRSVPKLADDITEVTDDGACTQMLDQGQETGKCLLGTISQTFDKGDRKRRNSNSCHHKKCCYKEADTSLVDTHLKCSSDDVRHSQLTSSHLNKKSVDVLHSGKSQFSCRFEKTFPDHISQNCYRDDKNYGSLCETTKNDCPSSAICEKVQKFPESLGSVPADTIENIKDSNRSCNSVDITSQNCKEMVDNINNDETLVQKFEQLNPDCKRKSTVAMYSETVDLLPLSQARKTNVQTLKRKLPLLKFRCLVCNQAFSDRMTLVNHKKYVHSILEDISFKGSNTSSEDYGVSVENKHKIRQTTDNNMNGHNKIRYELEKSKLFNSQHNLPGSGDSTAKTNLHSLTQSYLNTFTNWCLDQGNVLCLSCAMYHPQDCPCPQTVLVSNYNQNVPTKEIHHSGIENGTLYGSNTISDFVDSPLDMSKGCKSSPSVYSNLSCHAPLDLSSCSSYSSLMGTECHKSASPVESTELTKDLLYNIYPHSDSLTPLKLTPDPKILMDKKETSGASVYLPGSDSDVAGSSPENHIHPLSEQKNLSRPGFPCAACQRVFTYQAALFTHMKTHTLSPHTYKCQLCKQSFTHATDLKIHVCPNGVEKRFPCPSCDQSFAKNIHLKRHLATHSGLKPYPCWICGKRFSRSDHLKRHTQSLHAGSRPHGCLICGKDFVRKYEFNKHMISHSLDNGEH